MDKRSLIIKILNVIIVLLLIAIVVIIFKKGKPLNTNGKVVKDLYSYVGNNNLEKCGGLVFYSDEEINYDKFQLDNTTICYYDEDNYYCGLSEKYTYTIGAEPHTYRTIKSAYKKGDEIAIYDYFLRTINDDCFTSYMKDEKNETCGKALENKKEVDYKFLKKYGTRYVHIFKKSGDSYYWVSSKNLDK